MNILQKGTRVLLVSPHPDDLEFGTGGTLYEYRNNLTSKLLVLSTRLKTRGETTNKEQQQNSASILGIQEVEFFDLPIRFFTKSEIRDEIRQIVTKQCEEFKPDIIFIPAKNETMQDHQAITEEVTRIIHNISIVGYEVIAHNKFVKPNHKMYVKISQDSIDAKVNALSCFEEQKSKYYFDKKVIESLAVVRAVNAGFFGYAEAFDVYNLIQNEE